MAAVPSEEPVMGRRLWLPPLMSRLRPLLAAEEGPVYLVGGAVRDALLGRPNYDLDFVVAENAIGLAFRIGDALDAPAFVLDRERDIGRVMLEREATMLDFARFRGDDLQADLRARDFTINAMALPALNLTRQALIDPAGGEADLAAGLIRLAHDGALDADPVRTLRAVRLGTELNFELVPATSEAIRVIADRLSSVSAERIRDELTKLLRLPAAHEGIAMLHRLALLPVVLPEIAALHGVSQSQPHHEAVLPHTVRVLGEVIRVEEVVFGLQPAADPRLRPIERTLTRFREPLRAHLTRAVDGNLTGSDLLRIGALFHDVGKPATRAVEADGRVRFFGHAKEGALLAHKRLRALRFSKAATRHVEVIVAGHMRPLLLSVSEKVTRRAVYRFFRDCGSAGLDIGLLSLADHLATYPEPVSTQSGEALRGVIARLYEHYFENYDVTVAPPPLVRGDELIGALGLEPGPEVGRLLRQIEEAQAAGEVSTRGEALELARRMATSGQEAGN